MAVASSVADGAETTISGVEAVRENVEGGCAAPAQSFESERCKCETDCEVFRWIHRGDVELEVNEDENELQAKY